MNGSNDDTRMETICLAAGGLAAVALVMNYDKIPVLREYPIVSACKAMRSTVVRRFVPGGDDRASARVTTPGPYTAARGSPGSAGDPMTSTDEQGNTEQLADLARQAAAASTPAAVNNRAPPPQIEPSMMSNVSREMGSFQPRVGDGSWEFNLVNAPTETSCEAVTLPLSQYQTWARAARDMTDGIPSAGPASSSVGSALNNF